MFTLFKKLIGLAFFLVLISFALNYQIQGKPVRTYLVDFYRAPLIQELMRQGKSALIGYLHKDVGEAPPQDQITEKERQELEKVLDKVKGP